MAIERRVKPSERAREAMYHKRKPIAIALVVVLVVGVLSFAGVKLYQAFPRRNSNPDPAQQGEVTGSNSGLTSSDVSDRALSASGTSYTGTWADDASGRFSLYIPGEPLTNTSAFLSEFVTINEAGTEAYGVLASNQVLPTLDNDPTQDPGSILSVFAEALMSDLSAAMYGADFSGAYDMSSYTLSDGTQALWVSAEMQTMLSKQDESGNMSEPTTMNFPLCGFVVMRDDTPIFVWGIANPDDGAAVSHLNTYIRDCASTFTAARSFVSAPPQDDISAQSATE